MRLGKYQDETGQKTFHEKVFTFDLECADGGGAYEIFLAQMIHISGGAVPLTNIVEDVETLPNDEIKDSISFELNVETYQ